MIDLQVVLNFSFESADAVGALPSHDQIYVLILAKVGFDGAVQQFLVEVWQAGIKAELNLEASLAVQIKHLLDLERAWIPEIQFLIPFQSLKAA